MKRIFTASLLVALFSLMLVVPAYAQDYGYTTEMTMEEYQAELEKWQQREKEAQTRIEELNQQIEELKNQIADVENQIAQVKEETMNMLGQAIDPAKGSVEEQLDAYYSELDALISQLEGLLALSPEELYQRGDEVDAAAKQLEELKKSIFAALDESRSKISEAEDLLSRIKAKMPEPMNDVYTVVRGDYLWKISGKQDIYNDPYQWVKIWSANRDMIQNPDLIYPQQKLDVPRRIASNKHVVARGENLSKIAGYEEVYGNPFDWQRLYNANKQIISDPGVIYPHQILTVPQN